jgi:hypothetical protein
MPSSPLPLSRRPTSFFPYAPADRWSPPVRAVFNPQPAPLPPWPRRPPPPGTFSSSPRRLSIPMVAGECAALTRESSPPLPLPVTAAAPSPTELHAINGGCHRPRCPPPCAPPPLPPPPYKGCARPLLHPHHLPAPTRARRDRSSAAAGAHRRS